MAPLVVMLIASFGSHVSCVCAAPLVLGDGCSLSSPRFCSWGCAITEPLWSLVCCKSLHVSQQLVLRRCVGESLACCALRFLGHRNAVPACVFREHVPSAGEMFPVVFLVLARVLAKISLFATSTLGHLGLCASQVSISCYSAMF